MERFTKYTNLCIGIIVGLLIAEFIIILNIFIN
jgi:hypothetical protein